MKFLKVLVGFGISAAGVSLAVYGISNLLNLIDAQMPVVCLVLASFVESMLVAVGLTINAFGLSTIYEGLNEEK